MKSIEIKKKELKKLEFDDNDILQSNKKRRFRKLKLKSAVTDSGKNSKYKITLKSLSRGYFTVISRILVAEKDYAILEGGYIIPTKAIADIR